jgi:hypothetical protein
MPPVPDGGFYEQAGTCNAFEKYILTEGSPLRVNVSKNNSVKNYIVIRQTSVLTLITCIGLRGHCENYTIYIYTYIQGVTGGTDQTSGGCSLC